MPINVTLVAKHFPKHMRSSFFGVKLWILITFFVLFILLILMGFLSVCLICIYRRKAYKSHFRLQTSKNCLNTNRTSSLDGRLLSGKLLLSDQWLSHAGGATTTHRVGVDDLESSADRYSGALISDTWLGTKFTAKEIEVFTNGFADGNVIGNGDHGVVYLGISWDGTRVAVKRLSCQGEDFIAQAEVIGHVKHKNLVQLYGYCFEGAYRMLVHEYVDNGNLSHWLHECSEQVSHLTWPTRMKIIEGIAKGLAYLHEDIEPKIVHQDLKSSNILLDCQWNPKISDFGLTKLFEAHSVGTSCSLSQESVSTGSLSEKSDIYSFGILIMEIITGRTPVDQNQPQVYLIDWLKSMVANQKNFHAVDPKLPEMPCSKELKRILLIALRCVDPDLEHRPKMGDVVHMLEPFDLLLKDERWIKTETPYCNHPDISLNVVKSVNKDINTNEGESSYNPYQKMILPR